jgi:hypothetical protein
MYCRLNVALLAARILTNAPAPDAILPAPLPKSDLKIMIGAGLTFYN